VAAASTGQVRCDRSLSFRNQPASKSGLCFALAGLRPAVAHTRVIHDYSRECGCVVDARCEAGMSFGNCAPAPSTVQVYRRKRGLAAAGFTIHPVEGHI
jgi:hypothetical protein